MKHIPTAEESVKEVTNELDLNGWEQNGYRLGYNKSQETHPFSDEDMIDFAIWRTITIIDEPLTPRGELELWKSQKIKTLYYE